MTGSVEPELNRTMALRQLNSAESTLSAFSFSTCSWNTRMWSMKATTRSAAIGLACSPAAARSGATWSGMEHWAALRINSSLQARRNSATYITTLVTYDKLLFTTNGSNNIQKIHNENDLTKKKEKKTKQNKWHVLV